MTKGEGTRKEKSFEAALERLEAIVAEMEAGQLKLDAMLKKYEEGMLLARFCTKRLEQAEKKIEMLVKKEDGSFETVEFAAAEQAEQPGTVEAEQEAADEEQPLF